MKINTLVSSLAAALCLATHSSAAIVPNLDQITVTSGSSLHMNWSPAGGWSAVIGAANNGEPFYLTPAVIYNDPEYSYTNPADVGSWQGTALSMSTATINLNGVVDGQMSYSGYIDTVPGSGANYFTGLRYDLGGGNYDYGWVNYSTNADSTAITLLGAAFNTTANESILAGQTTVATVPEPSAYLIGSVFGGLALLRRRASR
ncbi:MAG: hypothetical protein WCJ14_12325 [Verrucomicrobiota bacterium]